MGDFEQRPQRSKNVDHVGGYAISFHIWASSVVVKRIEAELKVISGGNFDLLSRYLVSEKVGCLIWRKVGLRSAAVRADPGSAVWLCWASGCLSMAGVSD